MTGPTDVPYTGGILNFITSSEKASVLTPEAWDAAIKKAFEPRIPTPRIMFMSRYEHVTYDVVTRPDSWTQVRKPRKLRLRDARRTLAYRGEYGDEPRDWHYAWRELRKNTHKVLTPEDRREIQWRHAEIGRKIHV